MSSKHLIDPELVSLLETFDTFELDLSALPVLREQSAHMAKLGMMVAPLDPSVAVGEQHVPGSAGAPDVRVLIYQPQPKTKPAPAYLHIHGGGYVIGLPEMSHARNRFIAQELGCVVVSVDYRLAPETPHPGPVDDCYAAFKWMHANAEHLGIDRTRIAIGGESAGGGLSAALALLARDRGEIPLLFQLLIYPMIDDRTCTLDEPHPYVGEFIWTRSSNRVGWSALLGSEAGTGNISPYAAAARAQDLAGLPPTFISTGAMDLFLEEDIEYARRLTRAGVPTELHVYPGAYHGFEMAADADVSKESLRNALRALRRAFNA